MKFFNVVLIVIRLTVYNYLQQGYQVPMLNIIMCLCMVKPMRNPTSALGLHAVCKFCFHDNKKNMCYIKNVVEVNILQANIIA